MFLTVEETIRLINEGKVLHIAADEGLLAQLPQGKWIGGTTPYFITREGGILSKDKLYVSEMPFAKDPRAVVYDKSNVLELTADAYENGLTFLLLPFASEVTSLYAKEAPMHSELFMYPILGWVTGFDLAESTEAKVFNGFTGQSLTNKALALHINLPQDKTALIGVVNIFNFDAASSKIRFFEDALSVGKCLIDGREVVFSEYLVENKINTELPLIADYNGERINTSIKEIVAAQGRVDLYASVFKGKDYYFAQAVSDYAASFTEALKDLGGVKPAFSCNCILNYLYGELKGKTTLPFAGPVTFGEIAYQLLNQTLVYVEIV